MAVVSAAVLKSYFEGGDVPTCAQFVDLVDSTITGELISNITSAASAGSTGLLQVDSASAASFLIAGSAGRAVVSAGTQASVRSVISAASDASASTTQAGLIELATTAEATAGTDATRAITPATLAVAAAGGITLGTPQTTTSGTTFDFTNIPAGTNLIKIMFSFVSLSGTDELAITIGDSGGLETADYVYAIENNTTTASSGSAAFWQLTAGQVATATILGVVTLSLFNASTNEWIMESTLGDVNGGDVNRAAGGKALSATLDRLQIKTNGTDTFDQGSVNIQYQ